ncbi:MAG: YhdH/YhfP family quinone oxidoreductase [Rickettsiales bacterium]|nr:YhdH/YhfP family quinone oxidoreductase [Rickettsiales bacterium]
MQKFSAKSLVTEEINGQFISSIQNINLAKLSEGEVRIKTRFSSLNYKDALSASGHKGVTRDYPHIAGIDVAGEIFESNSDIWQIGDEVICTGFDLGMNRDGGFSEFVSVPAHWCIRKPDNLSLKDTMIFGTAGLTAALSSLKIINSLTPNQNTKILITGASGGVGLLTALLLKRFGFHITISTRNLKNSFLENYQFDEIIATETLNLETNKPIHKRQFNAAIDTLGGNILSNILKIIDYHGTVISCGNICGNEYNSSIIPMIIRGVDLIGITSANAKMSEREQAWKLLNDNQSIINDSIYRQINLEEVNDFISKMLAGKHNKRTVIAF